MLHITTLLLCLRVSVHNIKDKVRLIKAISGKSHRQLALESDDEDDDDTSDSMSVINNTPFMRLWLRFLASKILQLTVA